MIPNTTDVHVAIEGRIATLSINRESKLNALRRNTFEELMVLLNWADSSKNIGAVILRGNGRAFCAGVDLNEYSSIESGEALRAFQKIGRRAYESMSHVSKPVIASVHGYALGGGMALALGCDVIIASEGAMFGFPEIKRGMMPGGGTTARAPFSISPYVVKDLMFTGRLVDAREMMMRGIVSYVVEPGKLKEKSEEYAQALLEMPHGALASIKSLINDEMLDSASRYYTTEMESVATLFSSDERRKRMSEFTSGTS